jgi:hypothetical protein
MGRSSVLGAASRDGARSKARADVRRRSKAALVALEGFALQDCACGAPLHGEKKSADSTGGRCIIREDFERDDKRRAAIACGRCGAIYNSSIERCRVHSSNAA